MLKEQLEQNLFNDLRVQSPFNTDGEALTRALVDDAEHAEDLPIMRAVLNEVIRPDMAFVLWPEPDARSIIKPEPSSFWLLHWNLKPFTSPNAVHALLIHMPTVCAEQRGDTAIAISPEPGCQFDNGLGQRVLITACLSYTSSSARDAIASPILRAP